MNNTCGNSLRDSLEACDDGNVLSGDGCSSTCTVEASWECSGGSALAGAPAVSAPASLLVQGHSHSHSPLSLSLSPSLACSRAVSD